MGCGSDSGNNIGGDSSGGSGVGRLWVTRGTVVVAKVGWEWRGNDSGEGRLEVMKGIVVVVRVLWG